MEDEIGVPARHIPNAYDIYEGVDYDEYWKSVDKRKLDKLEHAIVNELLPARGSRLIDIGCGYGRLSDCYLDRFETKVMFDGSRSLLQAAQRTTRGKAFYVLGDINQLPFCSSAFDTVLMIRVFHHLNDSRACLKNAERILCGNGNLVMNYSNKRNIYRMIRFLLHPTSPNPFALKPLTDEPNFFHHHPTDVLRLLTESGFKISQYRGAGIFDRIARKTSSLAGFSSLVPAGVRFAPLLGKYFAAPWVFFKGVTQKKDPLRAVSKIEELLICPICNSGLIQTKLGFLCATCQREYPMVNGIIDMRVDAQPAHFNLD